MGRDTVVTSRIKPLPSGIKVHQTLDVQQGTYRGGDTIMLCMHLNVCPEGYIIMLSLQNSSLCLRLKKISLSIRPSIDVCMYPLNMFSYLRNSVSEFNQTIMLQAAK